MPNLTTGLKNPGEGFLGLNSRHGPDCAHSLDNKYVYCRSMKGKFSSLDSPIKNTMTKIGPRHFTCDKIEPIIS